MDRDGDKDARGTEILLREVAGSREELVEHILATPNK